MDLPEYLQELYAYHYWANHRILTAAEGLTKEQFHRQQGHSWGSIHGVLLHMMNWEDPSLGAAAGCGRPKRRLVSRRARRDHLEDCMAYDEGLAQRVREVLSEQSGLVEKKMFGGIGFMVHGNMACGIHKDALIVRVGPEKHEEALARPHTKPFDITGRPMKGWVMMTSDSYDSDETLKDWVQWGVDFALSLPAK